MSLRIIVFHGTGGSPSANWFPWIVTECSKLSLECIVPKFPTPEGQNLNAWLTTFSNLCDELKKDDILIGHSVGAAFALRLLEKSATPIRATILVAPFAKSLGLKDFDPLNSTFVDPPFEWAKIKSNSKSFSVYMGDNDPYVPLPFGLEVSSALAVEPQVIPGGKHLNAEGGYHTFPGILQEIRRRLSEKTTSKS